MDDERLKPLRRFVEYSSDLSWTRDSRYIAMDVSHGLYRYRKFEERSRRLEGPTLIFEAEWMGTGTSMQDVHDDFYAAYGTFAEQSQFITMSRDGYALVVTIMSGRVGRHAHGHSIEIRLIGDRISAVLASLPPDY